MKDDDTFDFDSVDWAVVYASNRGKTIQERFENFHSLNPWVYRAICALARDLVARGRETMGIKWLTEVVRWQYARQTRGDDFKLNNDYTSRYARLIMEREPDLATVFRIRKLQTP